MRSLAGILVAIVCSLLLTWPVYAQTDHAAAQTGRGTIAGTVRDERNSVLTSALIELQPLGKKAVSDDQGQFRITDVPAGKYSFTVSYVGFAPFTSTVEVDAGQVANVDAVLKVASQSDQVMVTAERVQGEAEAINIERLSEDIVQVLPSRVINSLPNTNIADAVGRAPSVSLERDEGEGKYVQIRGTEPRLSNVTINGVNVPSPEGTVRNIKLDAVPANLVERIEVFKTLSASQDADGIGGTVNLVTRTPGDKPTYNFGGQGGYTPIQGGRTLGGFDGTVGKRFGAEKRFGFLLGGTFDRNNRGIDDLEPSQTTSADPTGHPVAIIASEDLRSYSYYRTRYGFSGGVDYNLKPGTSVYLKGLYSDFHDFGETWVYTPNATTATDPNTIIKSVNGSQITFFNCTETNAPAGCTPGSMQYRHYVRRPDQQVFSILMGARHDLSSTLITYEFAGSRAHNIGGQDFPTSNFNGPQAVDLGLSLTDPLRPKLSPLDTTNVYDATQYSITATDSTRYHATQLNFQGATSLARRYNAHSHFGTFEIGLKIRNSQSTQREHDSFYDFNSGPPITLASVVGNFTNPTYYDKFFLLSGRAYGPVSDYNRILEAVQPNLGQFQLQQVKSVQRSEGAFFDANERIYAGYLQNAISIGKFRLQAGVRFEGTNTEFTTHHVDSTQIMANGDPQVTPFVQSSSYLKVLPSVQIQYLLEKNTNLRGNFSIGTSRPNLQDLVPTTIVDPNTSNRGTVTLGNPNLKPTKANNYDLLIEHFFQPLGILQAGFFYKQLSDPIYQTSLIIPPGLQNAGFFQDQAINGPNAHITGFEAAWEQRLSRLPSLLSGFGVAANYSYTTSQVTFPANFSGGRTDHPSLQRQAPNNWNVGVTYDKPRLSMRFAVSHNDANIFQYAFQQNSTPNDPILGLKGPTGDIYLYAHTQFDIQGSYRLYKGLSFFAYGLNLSNEVFGFYQGSGIYPIQREFYKPTAAFGMRWSSTGE
jgi:TonB-dependent receptor